MNDEGALHVVESADELPPLPPAGGGDIGSSSWDESVAIPVPCAAFLLGLVNRSGLPLETPGLIESFQILRVALAQQHQARSGKAPHVRRE